MPSSGHPGKVFSTLSTHSDRLSSQFVAFGFRDEWLADVRGQLESGSHSCAYRYIYIYIGVYCRVKCNMYRMCMYV